MAALIGGRRFWSNSGEALDCESENFVAQCKEVKTLSLNALADLAEQVEREALPKFKAGIVAVRIKRGPGRKKAPTLLVMTEATFRQLHGACEEASAGGASPTPPSAPR